MSSRAERRVPGEEGVWVLVGGDLLLFGVFFITIAVTRLNDPALFARSQAMLNQGLGLANTLILLTSSLFVALAAQRVKEGRTGSVPLFVAAIACGLCFAAIKLVEYGEKIRAGIGFTTNEVFTLYFAFTGIHLLHVIAGLAALTAMAVMSSRQEGAAGRLTLTESGAIFWHLVDLLWIVLFALFYLAGWTP